MQICLRKIRSESPAYAYSNLGCHAYYLHDSSRAGAPSNCVKGEISWLLPPTIANRTRSHDCALSRYIVRVESPFTYLPHFRFAFFFLLMVVVIVVLVVALLLASTAALSVAFDASSNSAKRPSILLLLPEPRIISFFSFSARLFRYGVWRLWE